MRKTKIAVIEYFFIISGSFVFGVGSKYFYAAE